MSLEILIQGFILVSLSNLHYSGVLHANHPSVCTMHCERCFLQAVVILAGKQIDVIT